MPDNSTAPAPVGATLSMAEDFAFCMAHHLPTFPDGHKCRNVHGHTCVLVVRVDVSDSPGFAFDHADLRAAVTPIVKLLCHAGLVNNVAPELADGLSESQLRWFWPQIARAVESLGASLVELEHAEGSAPGGVLLWHRKSYRGPS